MSTVTATSSYTAADAANTAARVTQKTLGQDDFLKLITVQMANQDPMNPQDDTAFIAQMSSFAALEAQTTLAKEMGYLRADTQMQAAGNFLGREVTVATADGEVTGIVDSVEADANNVYVSLGDQKYLLASIVRVRPAPTPAAEPAA